VGEGSGVSAATRRSGVEVVTVGEIGLRVEVEKGMGVEGRGVEVIPCGVHEARRKRKEERRRKAADGAKRMRRL
jgi:hypothetical protein